MPFDSLDKLLEPLPASEFLDASWGRSYAHVRGGRGKFASLMPWDALNEILRRHRLDHPRLRLMRDGKAVPVASYIRHTTSAPKRPAVPRLLPAGFAKHLREGATLVLDAVDELHAPVESLAEALELTFCERVQVNMYAGWRTSRGFDLHWDDHDVFVLQVAGRKRWQVYGETTHAPLAVDRGRIPKPEGEPLWDETLEDGDLLYIPRGWWHVALPLDEPTLHLTVGVHKRAGLDFARWLTDKMGAREIFREDLPRLADEEERRAHAARMREEFLNEFDDGAVTRYLEEQDASASPRARVGLPWAATPQLLPDVACVTLRWTPPRPVALEARGGVVEFSCLKRRWRFAEAALVVLRPLAERRVCTLAELSEGARGSLDERTVRALVRELILHGLVAIVEESSA
jgi:ribosomal protein L16 Arg81 hydroxylase